MPRVNIISGGLIQQNLAIIWQTCVWHQLFQLIQLWAILNYVRDDDESVQYILLVDHNKYE